MNPNLIGANLSGANLRGVNLSGADLFRANLHAATLLDANLLDANLSGANLLDADLFGANLQAATLLDANLRDANLSDANLLGGNLSFATLLEANLFRANLSGANLRDADLSDANLWGANLSGADLRGANLSDAKLMGAILSGADLSGADLRCAEVGGTLFGNLNLQSVRGLETITHGGPSTLGVDTLYKSDGKIPEVFLRGCGLPDEFVAYVPSLVGSAIDYYSCFISYNHEDKQFARQLHDRLQGQGIRCWLDEKALNPGDYLYDGIDRGIRVWDKLLLCASKHSLNSWWVDREITTALEEEQGLWRQRQQRVQKLIPLNLDGYLLSGSWQKGYAQDIRNRVAADFTEWKTDADRFDEQLNRVIKALRTDGGKPPEPVPKL